MIDWLGVFYYSAGKLLASVVPRRRLQVDRAETAALTIS